jgi:phage shock protein PspC (stress-responsive transcriptional regulator)
MNTNDPPAEPPAGGDPAAGGKPPAGGEAPAGGDPPAPRRLLRATDDRMVGGVCAGFARYFAVDPAVVRIAAVALALLGGAGVLLYLAALLLVPAAPATGAEPAAPDRAPAAVIAAVVLVALAAPLVLGPAFLLAGLLVPLAVLAVIGLVVWWLVAGEGVDASPREIARRTALGVGVIALCGALAIAGAWTAAVGGGELVAGIVIAAGVVIVAGAFVGRARWLILPALSVALAVGVVAAAGIDLRGGVGERIYRPATLADVRDGYRLGAGRLVVDLRDLSLPAGERRLELDLGVGEAVVLVPHDVCVATRARIGAGEADVFDRDAAGVDVEQETSGDSAPGTPRLAIDAEVGMGELRVGHHEGYDGPLRPPPPPFADGDLEERNVGCGERAAFRGDAARE